MTAIGIDVTSIAEWQARLRRTPDVRLAAFTASERAWCGEDPTRYALAWAVKEAAVKLVGTGFDGIGWRGVWSRPAGAGFDVGFAEAAHAGGLSGPLECATWRDGDVVVVALAAGAGPVAVRALRFRSAGDRRGRHDASRRAARHAAGEAAIAVAAHPDADLCWITAPDRAPRAVWADGTTAIASFAHGRSVACAAVAAAQGVIDPLRQQSHVLVFKPSIRLQPRGCRTER